MMSQCKATYDIYDAETLESDRWPVPFAFQETMVLGRPHPAVSKWLLTIG